MCSYNIVCKARSCFSKSGHMTWNIIAYLWIRVQTRSEKPRIVYTISIYSIWQWMSWTKITRWIIETAMSTVHPENTLWDDISQMNHQPRNEKCQLGNEKLSPLLFTYRLTLCGWPWWEQHTGFNGMISLGGKRAVTMNLVGGCGNAINEDGET